MRIDENPFAAPMTESLVDPGLLPVERFLLADPGKRFLRRFVDNLFVWIPPIALAVFLNPESPDHP